MTLALDKVHCMDCIEGLRLMDDESVHCCVTSPPYWGLRDYGNGRWEGGDPACDHIEKNARNDAGQGIREGRTPPEKLQYKDACPRCGARRVDAGIGLEPTLDMYLEHLVELFREVRRVLRKDGTCWVNMGDAYAGSWGNAGHRPELDGTPSHQREKGTEYFTRGGWDDNRKTPPHVKVDGLKSKDLIGLPWRVAFALQADGWYLRSDIIWSKPNPMPESVTDRPTKAHEYVFLLSKAQRYFYDADAVREASSGLTGGCFGKGGAEVGRLRHDAGNTRPPDDGYRNRRSVWHIATMPYQGAHFATFPEALVEPCILAGCPQYVCSECGTPMERFNTSPDVIEYYARCGTTGQDLDMQRMPKTIQGQQNGGQGKDILLKGMQSALGDKNPKINEGEIPDDQGVHTGAPSRTPGCVKDGLYNGTPAGDGEEDRKASDKGRSGASYKPRKERQPPGKSGDSGKAVARPYEEAAGKADNVPTLRQDAQSVWTCPKCGGHGVDSGIVLDVFMGSGTTGSVALRLNRHFVGFELNPDYVRLANERIYHGSARLDSFTTEQVQ